MILLSNMTQFNQMTELWILASCPKRVEPPQSMYICTLMRTERKVIERLNAVWGYMYCYVRAMYVYVELSPNMSVFLTVECGRPGCVRQPRHGKKRGQRDGDGHRRPVDGVPCARLVPCVPFVPSVPSALH